MLKSPLKFVNNITTNSSNKSEYFLSNMVELMFSFDFNFVKDSFNYKINLFKLIDKSKLYN